MKKLKTLFSHKFIFILLAAYFVPLVISLWNVFSGSIPFWYDPARDMLQALDNLHKPTLIGPPSGIPGIFYGPYWIWLLSLGLLVSHDPKVVAFVVLVIPYFIFFPYLLYCYRNIFTKEALIIIWLFFMFAFGRYANFIWNPHLSPLLFLLLTYLIVTMDLEKQSPKTYLRVLLSGCVAALAFNFHISFGVGLLVGTYLFFVISFLLSARKKREKLSLLLKQRLLFLFVFSIGVGIMFLPFLAFESRHNFLQTQALLKTLLSPTAVVSQIGLTRMQIFEQITGSLATLLSIPPTLALGLIVLLAICMPIHLKKSKQKLQETDKKLLLFLLVISLTVLMIYLTSKNPVWEYHFINVEMIFLLLLAWCMSKSFLVRNILGLWVIVISFLHIVSFLIGLSANPHKLPTLATKEYIVNTVYQDAGDTSFAEYTYNPAIYTYDFDYLFSWIGKNLNRNVPKGEASSIVYLIIPETSEAERDNFIHYRTPDKSYVTLKTWKIDDGSVIIKRSKRN